MNRVGGFENPSFVESKSNTASTSESHFAQSISSASEINSRESVLPANQKSVGASRTLRVLVAEDNVMAILGLFGKLPQADRTAEFSYVGCGEDAKNAILGLPYQELDPLEFKTHPAPGKQFDIALLDNQMPDQFQGGVNINCGRELAHFLRNTESVNQAAISCFLIGHSGDVLDKNETAVDGRILFDGVVKKPGSIAEYKKILSKALNIVRMQERVEEA